MIVAKLTGMQASTMHRHMRALDPAIYFSIPVNYVRKGFVKFGSECTKQKKLEV